MKHLLIKSRAFLQLEKAFGEWLVVLGYPANTTRQVPVYIHEYFHWLEQQKKTRVTEIHPESFNEYFYTYLQFRPHHFKPDQAISRLHLNLHLHGFRLFIQFLRQNQILWLPKLEIPNENCSTFIRETLTVEEVRLLFEATDMNYDCPAMHRKPEFYTAMQLRDRVILSLFYGCGLRGGEGINLNVEDFLVKKSLLHIRKSKNYLERFVPVSQQSCFHLSEWIAKGRNRYVHDRGNNILLLSIEKKRLSVASVNYRLKMMIRNTGNETLQQKSITTYSLRHSIATHLMQKGMTMEHIALFLGHRDLSSTQVYTHLLHD